MSRKIDATSLTVSDLVSNGAESVQATCGYCGHAWSAPITFLPEAVTVAKIATLLVCPTCDHRDVDVEPDWSDSRSLH